MAIHRPIEIGTPRVLGFAVGACFDTEDEALPFISSSVSPYLAAGGVVLAVIADGSAVVYQRTLVEWVQDPDIEPEGPYFIRSYEVVSAENGTHLSSIVVVNAMFTDLNAGPVAPWVRIVGFTELSDFPVFGLVEMPPLS
mgnify:CR=1 FL=1